MTARLPTALAVLLASAAAAVAYPVDPSWIFVGGIQAQNYTQPEARTPVYSTPSGKKRLLFVLHADGLTSGGPDLRIQAADKTSGPWVDVPGKRTTVSSGPGQTGEVYALLWVDAADIKRFKHVRGSMRPLGANPDAFLGVDVYRVKP